jgi:putative ABC transport system ATP-binding protein
MLNLRNICLKPVLNHLDLDLKKGEFVVVIGANGAGKSTLLNIISGNITPTHGQIILDGQDVTNVPASKRSIAIAKVSQDPKVGTMTNMTIYENLAFAMLRGKRRGLGFFSRRSYKKLFKSKLEMLNMGLENRLNELVANLSGGQRQALSLIMALLADSKVLLLDEITAALDPNTAENIMRIAAQIVRAEQRTTIMITHNMKHALEYGDRTILLANGKFSKQFDQQHRKELTPSVLAAEFC